MLLCNNPLNRNCNDKDLRLMFIFFFLNKSQVYLQRKTTTRRTSRLNNVILFDKKTEKILCK